MAIINILHTYEPSPILMTLGPITIYWYGLFYAVNIALGYWLVWRTLKRQIPTSYLPADATHQALQAGQLPARRCYTSSVAGGPADNSSAYGSRALGLMARLPELAFGLVVSGLVGARLYHVLNEWSYYWAHPLRIFAVWNGGLAIHGALIAGLIFLWFYTKRQSTSYLPSDAMHQALQAGKLPATSYLFWLLDLLAPAVLLGQAIGRWGNYFNQELFGYPTSLPWSIPISLENRPLAFQTANYFHPTFLYESLWDLMGFVLLLDRKSVV